MAETIFFWIFLFACAVAFTFVCLIAQDLWRQRRHKRNANTKPLRVSHRFKRVWRPMAHGYDYPELFLEDIELRMESDEKATETKTQA
jgi:hypothetical protein